MKSKNTSASFISRWFTSRNGQSGVVRLGLVLAAMCGIFLGLSLYTFQYGGGLSYFSKDPAACVNCHIMKPQFDSWQKASHHAAAGCVDCHLPHDFIPKWLAKAENGFLHSKGFTFQNFHEPIFIRERSQKILNQNCIDCHFDFVHEVMLEATHEADSVRCVHCHRSAGHGETIGLGKYQTIDLIPKTQKEEDNDTQ